MFVDFVDAQHIHRRELIYGRVTRRAQQRARRAWNAGVRAWLLAIGRDVRARQRLDPPCDYDDIPF